MEKFTVDLDKVLDEFEFSEEEAIRHALQHFKREDLPATKYQKPHFKPINIADADFKPCIETTRSFSTFHTTLQKEDISDSLVNINCESNENHESDKRYLLSECSTDHNVGGLKEIQDSTQINPSSNVNCIRLNCSEEEAFNLNNTNNTKQSEVTKENESKINEKSIVLSCKEENIICNSLKEKKILENFSEKIRKNEDVNIPTAENNNKICLGKKDIKSEGEIMTKECDLQFVDEERQIFEESLPKEEEKEENGRFEPETFKIFLSKSDLKKYKDCKGLGDTGEEAEEMEIKINAEEEQLEIHKPDLIENEITNFSSNETILCGKKLPDLTDVSPTKLNEIQTEKDDDIKSLDLIQSDKENVGKEIETLAFEALDTTKMDSSTCSKTPSFDLTLESDLKIVPIRFDNQLDITDEELQKYLEELEEEDEAEKRNILKPPRPDSLHLEKSKDCSKSPGQTPSGADVEDKEFRSEEENSSSKSEEEKQKSLSGEERNHMGISGAEESREPTLTLGERRLGKVSPFWMPDHLASSCMECDGKFTVIKRRHHCRACGRILCSKCCSMRASLEYLQNQEQRVCETCFHTLAKVMMHEIQGDNENESSPKKKPNPNNPMEYCSTIPPPLQVPSGSSLPPPSVLVPVGVLKREGSSKVKEVPKQVMFSDGIRPGGDLTELDGFGDSRNAFRKSGRIAKRVGTPPGNSPSPCGAMLPPMDPDNQSFVLEKGLPPVCIVNKGETTYEENWSVAKIMNRLRDPDSPPLDFAINRNLVASVKIVKLECCMQETCWVISSKGMGCVGQDEIVVLLTLTGEENEELPKEVFLQFHYLYKEAAKGNTVNELGYWCLKDSTFLGSKQHGGFLFVRPTFQCLNRIQVPPPPYLFGILVHRSEIPWAKVFPLRLILRLGAEFRYYPCPLVSVRFREPVYYEVGHTIINLLADFRNLSYTLPTVRGLRIHMEANQTSILIPRNRYDQVVRALNNSNDPVLALAGNFSTDADAHLVCMQSKGNEVTYSTHAININDKPRKVTGASFVVLNGALKTTSGMAAKSSIVEDGLMVQVPSDTMTSLRTKLRNMEDWSVQCGPLEGSSAEEIVRIVWSDDDKNFNIGVKSGIDNMALDGVPSIRVHSSKDYMGSTKFIRWTQVFIIKCEDGATSVKIGDPLEVNKLAESIAKATCLALVKLLELLAASGLTVLSVRATVDQDNVCYEAGSNGEKLPPIYMNSLDNELIPVLHKAASSNDSSAVLELIFHVMDQ